MQQDLTIDYLRECFDYEQKTGIVRWRERPRCHFKNNQVFSRWNNQFAGHATGCKQDDRGYRLIGINNKSYYLHRVAWALLKGIDLASVPEEIDHRDLDPSNNREDNLRAATRSQNGSNRRKQKNNTSGHKGVGWHKQAERWRARIMVNNKEISLGLFANKEDAIKARAAANDIHGEFARAA